MKYTRSRDGIDRINLRVVIRVDRAEFAKFGKMAAVEEMSLHEFLYDCLQSGLWAAEARQNEDAEREEVSDE